MRRRERIKHGLVVCLSRLGLKSALLAASGGYLRSSGWVRSGRARRPVDASGKSQPWLTMPAIAFLDGRLTKEMTLFEYGSGGSTAWYASRVRRVTAVEHDRHWYDVVRNGLPPNVDLTFCAADQPGTFLELVFRPLGDPIDYARAIAALPSTEFPHVVVVDGVDRLNCIAVVAAEAPNSTVIVVDNLEYAMDLAPAIELLRTSGYRQLDFWGIAPGELRLSNTAVFYRVGNCFGI